MTNRATIQTAVLASALLAAIGAPSPAAADPPYGSYHCIARGAFRSSVAFLNQAHIHYTGEAFWDTITADDGATVDVVFDGSWWRRMPTLYEKQINGLLHQFWTDAGTVLWIRSRANEISFDCRLTSGAHANDASGDDTLAPSGDGTPDDSPAADANDPPDGGPSP
jgi:hypothetical protein